MQLFSDQYDIKVVARYLLMAVTAIAVWKATSGIGAAVISLFVIWAVIRERPIEMMFWVLFMTYTSAGNRQLMVANAVSVTTVRATLMLLSIMLVTRLMGGGREARLITPFWGIMVYVAWEAIVSFQGFSPGVSYLKLILFISVFLAMFGVANTVNRSTRTNAKLLRSAILAIITLIIGGSFLLIPFPSLSMMVDKAAIEAMLSGEGVSLFQGMTSHSQVMGPMAGILGTFLFADLAFSIKKWDKLYLALLVLCPILIYKTSSRTGMGTFIAGIGIVVFLVMRARGLGAHWKGRLMMAVNTLIVLGAIGVCAVPNIRERAAGFALKWAGGADSADVSVETMMSSRQGLIDESVRNFKAKPFQGNGFQVSADMAHQARNSIVDYLTAPIEKGVWIYAIPEEGGIIGMVLFCGWLIVLFVLLVQRHAYIGLSVFFAFLTANLGEFSMFSTSYIGGVYWTLTFAAVCLDVQRMKSTNIQVFDVPVEVVMEEVGYDEWVRKQG